MDLKIKIKVNNKDDYALVLYRYQFELGIMSFLGRYGEKGLIEVEKAVEKAIESITVNVTVNNNGF